MPNINVVRRGLLIGFVTKLGSRSSGVLVVRNLGRSSALPIVITKVMATPQMVFTNLIMSIHVNRIANQTLMNPMDVGGYGSVDVVNLRRG